MASEWTMICHDTIVLWSPKRHFLATEFTRNPATAPTFRRAHTKFGILALWWCGMLGPLPFFLKRELLQYIGGVLRGFDSLKVNTTYFCTFGYLSQPWIVGREGRSSHQQKLAEHGYWPATNCKEHAISLRHHATTYSCTTNQMHTIYRKNVANMYTIHTNIKCRLNAYKWCHYVPRQTTLH